jgi:small neutral amino acid transporter SnatA (MarC family)
VLHAGATERFQILLRTVCNLHAIIVDQTGGICLIYPATCNIFSERARESVHRHFSGVLQENEFPLAIPVTTTSQAVQWCL